MTFRMAAENNCNCILRITVSLSISYLQHFLIHLSQVQVTLIFLLTFTNKLILRFLSLITLLTLFKCNLMCKLLICFSVSFSY